MLPAWPSVLIAANWPGWSRGETLLERPGVQADFLGANMNCSQPISISTEA